MLRFIHISDSHIIGQDSASIGTGPVQNDRFDLLTDAIAVLPVEVDFVVHTGDLSDDESEDSEGSIKQQLQLCSYILRKKLYRNKTFRVRKFISSVTYLP